MDGNAASTRCVENDPLRHWLCTAAIVSAPINVPVSANTMLSP
jgi:hypothetical protein